MRHVLESGEVIASYPDDTPYPSRLLLGWSGARALHVVVPDTRKSDEVIVVTVYEPDPTFWEKTFRRRREP
ncbi:MAG: DUF4258 domain-containing protein [Alphaproteobacteria bacterium]